jgi:ribosomal protein L32
VGKPKKRTSSRKTGLRRSHIALTLARMVNGRSPVKVRTTKNESGKMTGVVTKRTIEAKVKELEPKKTATNTVASKKAKPSTKK